MNDDLLAQFLVEGRELVVTASHNIAVLARAPSDTAALDGCFRAIHTLKGSTGLFDIEPMGRILHAAEDLLAAIRAGRPGSSADFTALLAVVDQVDRWLDALEQDGALPAGAAQAAREAIARLGGELAEPPPKAEGWRPPSEFAGLAGTAIRYVPRADAYFFGDDPVAIIAAVPGLTALRIEPREPWGSPDSYDPFACNLVISAVSSAGRPAVEAALRLVADQVELANLAPVEPAVAEGGLARRTLRVDSARVDRLASLAEELVVAKSGLAELAAEAERLGGHAIGQSLRARQAQLDRLVGDLHATVGRVRLMPLSSLFGRFPRLARDIARSLGKSVAITTEGGEVEVDKAVVDGLFDPLLHVLRNAVDHGVEAPATRHAAGKPEEGLVRISARPDADRVVIEVADDGAGIDPGHIRDLAVARGLLPRDAADALDDVAAVDLIFMAGFSTAASVSEVSGRGVGMDVVRAAAAAMGGRVEIAGTPGRGTAVRFHLPIATMLTKVMVVACGPDRYGLALDGVVEATRVEADRIHPVRDGRAFLLRDRPVPLVSLGALAGNAAHVPRSTERVVVARAGGELVGFAVDAILDRMDAVVRPMTGLLAGAPGVMGTTLLADGSVLMVLDPAELLS